MPTKISQLEAATDVTASDLIQIVDIEDTGMAVSGTNKKITAQLLANDLAGIVSDGSIATSKLASGALPSGVTVSSTNIVNGTIIDADINDSAAIAGSKISPSFTAPSVISVDSSSDALRITQTGTGNALVVEDSANPDSTPFIVDSNGNVTIGTTTAQTSTNYPLYIESTTGSLLACGTNVAANSPTIGVGRRRTGLDSVISGDSLGKLSYFGWDGSNYIEGSRIASDVDGTPGVDDMPGRLEFSTTADGASTPTERMRITSEGNVGIGTTSPAAFVDISSSSSTDILRAVAGAGATGGSAAGVLFSAASDLVSITALTNDALAFGTNNTERARIDTSGNVGIGTVTPSSKLHVAGDLTMSSATVATSATAGTNGDVPAQVAGYLVVSINGTARKIPYYA